MMRIVLSIVLTLLVSGMVQRHQSDTPQSELDVTTRFEAVDVYLDVGDTPLAAYQLEIAVHDGDVKFVGVEGGAHTAFADPPYYDPKALTQSKLIIAAFNTGDDLPAGNVRVARVHVCVLGKATPEYEIQVTVAANTDGSAIEASADLETGVETE